MMNKKQTLSIIAAHDMRRGIGKEGDLPWRLPPDLKRFKELTTGNVVIMGRRTFESIGSKPLPGRVNIVLTKNTKYDPKGAIVNHSLDEALATAREIDCKEIFIIGGEAVFKESLPKAQKLYITQIDEVYEADTFFPEITGFKEIKDKKDQYKDIEYHFLEYERV